MRTLSPILGSALSIAILSAVILAGCAPTEGGTGTTATGLELARAEYPLFGPDKEAGIAAFVAATKNLKRPPTGFLCNQDCERFISDLLDTNSVQIEKPNFMGVTLSDVLAKAALDRCPRTIFQPPPPPPFFSSTEAEQPGEVYERYEAYAEQAAGPETLLTYRKAGLVHRDNGRIGLHSMSAFAMVIDPVVCKSTLVTSETEVPKSTNVDEDSGVFLLDWQLIPIVAVLSRQTTISPDGGSTEIWSLTVQSQIPNIFPLQGIVSWRK